MHRRVRIGLTVFTAPRRSRSRSGLSVVSMRTVARACFRGVSSQLSPTFVNRFCGRNVAMKRNIVSSVCWASEGVLGL